VINGKIKGVRLHPQVVLFYLQAVASFAGMTKKKVHFWSFLLRKTELLCFLSVKSLINSQLYYKWAASSCPVDAGRYL